MKTKNHKKMSARATETGRLNLSGTKGLRSPQIEKVKGQKRIKAPELKDRVQQGFPIVGVGASAGGLEAFTELLKHLPIDTGMGFVLVQHLSPDHESALANILTRATAMPVREVTNKLRVEPNCVYVIPPNTCMAISGGVLKLRPRDEQGREPHHSIDVFFESLAHDQHERAIGVVLSGTASDGTMGLEAIKAEGGITFAQDKSAKYDSMPRSAEAAGCVDYVISPGNIANELARIAKHPFVADAFPPELPSEAKREGRQRRGPEASLKSGGPDRPPAGSKQARGLLEDSGFKKPLLLLRNHSGVDFSLYKTTTIQRRITRRMVVNKQTTLDGYAHFLKGNAKELNALYSDVLISVTSFFRNPEAFEALKQRVFPKLAQQQKRDDPLRVWALGCSTGQEAYSIAMAYAEFSEHLPRAPRLQVFATDLNEAVLEKARPGLYAKSLVADVSPDRLRRFFVEEEGGYRVIKALREQIVFARQNVLNDPPFSRLDLISCRNMLIYIEPHLQKKIIPTFHYALKPNGFLFLGASESIGAFTNLFEPEDKRQKIFSKKPGGTPTLQLPASRSHAATKKPIKSAPFGLVPDGFRTELSAHREADRVMVSEYAPPGVLINAELQILQFRGATSDFLEAPSGRASFDLLKMAREDLMAPLRAVINKAKKDSKPVRKENVRVNVKGRVRTVSIKVTPLKNLSERCYLVLFEETPKAGSAILSAASRELANGGGSAQRPGSKKEESRRIAELESELAETRAYLQSIQEQHESANEELQASTEEVQSANEELQASNEELETSKEELQSTNEELTTVNEEMANRNAELNRISSDLSNLHVSINTPILVLGRDLTIRRFTRPAEKVFNLLASDAGRPLGNIKHTLDFPDLEQFVTEVISSVSARQRDVQDQEGRWYSVRARPYMTLDNKIDGAVLMLVDIDDLKRSEQETKEAHVFADAILQEVPPLLILDKDLRVVTANDLFYKQFKVLPAHTVNRLVYDLGDGQWNIPKLRNLLEEILPRHSFFNDYEVTHNFGPLGRRTILLHARQLDSVSRIVLRLEDVTERLESRAAMKRSEIRYRRLDEAAQDGILILDPVSRKIVDANPFMIDFLGYSREELMGKELWQIGLLKDEQASHAAFRELQIKGFIRYEDLPLQTKAGAKREVEFVSNLYDEDGRQVIQCNIRDISERNRAVTALRASEERFRTAVGAVSDILWTNNAEGEMQGEQPGWGAFTGQRQEDYQGYGWSKAVHPEDAQPTIDAWKVAVAEKRTFEFEHRARRRDGEWRLCSIRAVPVLDPQGVIREWIGVHTDITERRQSEEALRESAQRLHFLAESMPQKIFTAKPNGDVDYFNAQWMEFTGLTFGQIRDWGWLQFIHPDDVEENVRRWKHSVETGEYFQLEHRFRRQDGEYRWHLSRAQAMRDTDGRILKWMGSNTDIEDQKRAEVKLERTVEERTAKLQETIAELEAFSYSVSHDMRAPLRAMRSFAQLLLQETAHKLNPEESGYLEKIAAAAARMDNLIRDVLLYSQVLRSDLKMESVDLDQLVRAIIATYPHLHESDRTILIEGVLSVVKGNETSLTQCVSNLLTNAVKFVAQGTKPRIKVWAEEIDGDVRLWVEDNGVGIEAKDQKRIFEMFERVGNAKAYDGTGIGLTIVHKAVQRMGGRIGVESEVGNGSKFWIQLKKGQLA